MIRVAGVAAMLLPLLLVTFASRRAAADETPTIDLGGCPIFDVRSARQAILAELMLAPAQRVHLGRIGIVVSCPEASAAVVEVTLAPDGTPLRKRLEFGDLVGDQRLRLVALVVAELVALALVVVPESAAPPPSAPSAPATPAPSAPSAPAAGFEGTTFLRRRALLGHDATRARGFVRGGVRVFLDRPGAMPDVAVGLSRGPFALDLFAATRRSEDSLGTMRAALAGVGLGATLVCGGGGGTWVCLGGRAAAGAAAVLAEPARAMIVSHDATSPYFEAGPRLEIRLEHARWSAELAVALGWSWGLAALAGDREVVRLSGPLVAGALTLGWTP
jgi:hypothetical protein